MSAMTKLGWIMTYMLSAAIIFFILMPLCKRLRYLEEKRFIKTFQKLDISDYDLATEVRFL